MKTGHNEVVLDFNWGEPTLDGDIEVRRVGIETWMPWMQKYHYSKTGPMGATYYGIFRPDLAAVVGVGLSANEHGIAKRYGLDQWNGNLEIVRVACHPQAPRFMASQGVAAILKLFADQGVDWVFSYADTGENHHGGIYQALNAIYVGLNMEKPITGYLVEGVQTHPRSIVAKYGTQSNSKLLEMADQGIVDIDIVPDLIKPKHTYILPISKTRWINRKIKKHLVQYAKPYPKREPTSVV